MLLASEFKIVLDATGNTVTLHPPTGPDVTAKCIIQSTSKASEQIVQTYGINGMSFQFAASDVVPKKMDQVILANNERYTIASVIPHHERGGTGKVASYTAYAKGR